MQRPVLERTTFILPKCDIEVKTYFRYASKAGGVGYQEECAPTLKASDSGTNMVPSVLCLNDQGGSVMDCSEDVSGTLRAQEHEHQPLVYENHGIDARYAGPHRVAPTMSARYGTGGNNAPLVEQDTSVYCIVGNAIDRQPQNGGNGIGYQKDIAYTLTATDHHAVFSRQRVDVFTENEVVSTESARQHKDATDLVAQPYQDAVGTLVRSDHKGISNQYVSDDKCIVHDYFLHFYSRGYIMIVQNGKVKKSAGIQLPADLSISFPLKEFHSL